MMTEPRSTAPTPDEGEPAGSGALPRLSRRGWIWVALGLAALIAVTAFFAWGQASQPVRWRDVGFSAPSPTEATATYDVFLYTDDAAECHVRALNERFAEVGVATQRIDPSDGAEQRVTTAIATTELATTATVNYCVLVAD